jgi:hypothetical protein
MKITKTYEWKIITQDGLLKTPPKFGPYYNEEDLNNYGGFDTEEEAISQFLVFNDRYYLNGFDDYTLICIYGCKDDE